MDRQMYAGWGVIHQGYFVVDFKLDICREWHIVSYYSDFLAIPGESVCDFSGKTDPE